MRKRTAAHLAVLAALALAASVPLLDAYPTAGHSSLIDIVRLAELDSLYANGTPFSAWVPDLYFGRGMPLFRYYAPLPYHLAELAHLAGLSIPSSLDAVYVAAFLLSGFGAYRLFSMLRGPAAGLAGGALYLLAPYRFVNVYVRSALGESLALAILPWLAAALVSCARGGRRGSRTAAPALLFAALIVTHNLSALLALPTLAVVVWLSLPRPAPAGWAPRAAAAMAAGALLAGIYWYPAVAGAKDVWLRTSVTGGFFDYRRHFASPRQLLATAISFGVSGDDADGTMPLPVGPAHLAVAAAALAVGLRRGARDDRRHVAAGALLTALSLLMTVRVSAPLWETIPVLPYVQFPWRFLGPAALGTAWLGASLVPRGDAGRRAGLVAAGLVLAAAVAAGPWVSSRYLRFDESIYLSPEGIRGRMIKTTGYHDYLPIGVRRLPDAPPTPRFTVLSGEASVVPGASGALRHEAAVTSARGAVLECRVFWFPGWEAHWNGVPVETLRANPDGTVVVAVPPGYGILAVRWRGDPLRRRGAALSLLGAAMILLVAFAPGRRGRPGAA